MRHFQVCFTRLGRQGVNDGWQIVNASPGLSQEAVELFSRMQNSNVSTYNFHDKDNGTDNINCELQSVDNYTFYTYIDYGLKDQMGRPSLFAHSYVFYAEEFIKNPDSVLRITRENFFFDVESTKEERVDFILTKDDFSTLSLLDRPRYEDLMTCIYYILDLKTNAPLNIVCDCSDITVKKLVSCIFGALPYAFRKKFSFAVLNPTSQKKLIFNRKLEESKYHFVIETGQNNILEDAKKCLGKYSFASYIPDLSSSSPFKYFDEIDRYLVTMGEKYTSSLDLVEFACNLYEKKYLPDNLEKLTNTQIIVKLAGLLNLEASSNVLIDRAILNILQIIIKRKITLNEIIGGKLKNKIAITENNDLKNKGRGWHNEY